MTLNKFIITRRDDVFYKNFFKEEFDAMQYDFEIPTNGWFCVYKKGDLTTEKKKIFVALYPPNTVINVEFEYRKGEMIVKV